MPTSVRLDRKTERLVERLATEKGLTKSEVIRKAIATAAEREAQKERSIRPYDALRHLIGSVRGGPTELSSSTGKRFRQLLDQTRARHR